MSKFMIDDHSSFDKEFELYNHAISMQVDYDDVEHSEVDAAALYIQKLLNDHWNDEEFMAFYKCQIMADWNDDVDRIQSEYTNIEEYLNRYGFKIIAK
jgi:hypothetical protein